MLTRLNRTYLTRANPGPTLRSVIAAHDDSMLRATDMAAIIRSNPMYAKVILSLPFLAQKISQWEEEAPDRADTDTLFTDRIAGLLGKSALRNVVAAIRLRRAVLGGLPRKEGERVDLSVAQLIPMSIACEEYYQQHSIPHAEKGFAAGLHYDWLNALFINNKDGKPATDRLSKAFKEGQVLCQIARAIGLQMREMTLNEYLCAAAWLLPLGSALMNVTFPKGASGKAAWSEFEALQSKREARARQSLIEGLLQKRRFDTSDVELLSLFVSAFELFLPVERAIRYSRTPWFIEGSHPDEARFSNVLSITRSLRASFPLTGGSKVAPTELPLPARQRKWLIANGVSEKALLLALSELSKSP